MALDALALAEVHLDLLYVRDSAGLLVRTRDPDPLDARRPWLHLVRTVEGNRWLLSDRLSSEQRSALEEALRAEPVVAGLGDLEGASPLVGTSTSLRTGAAPFDGLRGALGGLLPPGARESHRGPAFVFPDGAPVLRSPLSPSKGGVEGPSTNSQVELLEDPRGASTVPALAWVRDASAAARPLCVARNAAGEVVAACHSSRATPEAAAAGVETPIEYRGRGLGTAVVAGWAAAVRAEGRLPFYGTEWSNPASRAIARKLGLIMFGEDYWVG